MRALPGLLATLILCFSTVAAAGVYIEPLAGYQQVQTEYQFKPALGGTTDKQSITGLVYGAELGYIFSKLRLGAEIQFANQEVKTESTGLKRKWTTTSYVGIIGYEFPEKIVGYIGVGTGSTVDDQTPKTTVTGMVLKLGGSRELVKHVSVSVEYLMYTWNETKTEGGATTKISDSYEKFNSAGVQANIRFPFEFGGK